MNTLKITVGEQLIPAVADFNYLAEYYCFNDIMVGQIYRLFVVTHNKETDIAEVKVQFGKLWFVTTVKVGYGLYNKTFELFEERFYNAVIRRI